jgi:hypothetical protein
MNQSPGCSQVLSGSESEILVLKKGSFVSAARSSMAAPEGSVLVSFEVDVQVPLSGSSSPTTNVDGVVSAALEKVTRCLADGVVMVYWDSCKPLCISARMQVMENSKVTADDEEGNPVVVEELRVSCLEPQPKITINLTKQANL